MDKTAQLILRVGVAFAFLYPPYSALQNPDSWIGYFPQFLLNSGIPSMLLLHGFGIIEVIVALWLLSGWRLLYPSLIAFAMLIGIVAFNFSQMEVVFRDISIAAAALALAADAWYRNRQAPQAS